MKALTHSFRVDLLIRLAEAPRLKSGRQSPRP